jgi:hypothetical protein
MNLNLKLEYDGLDSDLLQIEKHYSKFDGGKILGYGNE